MIVVADASALAQLRGDYAQAEQRYQAALTIDEELGNRAGIASTTSQLGVLRTEQGRAADGIPYNISALAIRLDLESPEVSTEYILAGQAAAGSRRRRLRGNPQQSSRCRWDPNGIEAVNSFQNRSDPG